MSTVKRVPRKPFNSAAASDEAPMTLGDVSDFLRLSKRTINRLLRTDPSFPKPNMPNTRLQRWAFGDVRAWRLKQPKVAK